MRSKGLEMGEMGIGMISVMHGFPRSRKKTLKVKEEAQLGKKDAGIVQVQKFSRGSFLIRTFSMKARRSFNRQG